MIATMKLQDNVCTGRSVDVASTHEQTICSHVDYRLIENRREGFLQLWAATTAALDVDPSMWMISYLNERFEHSIEERLWFSWLFHTYCLPTSWAIKQEFPDEELASVERFEAFVNENYYRILHERDTKWTRGKIPEMYTSYYQWVGGKSQKEKFDEHCQGSPEENFWTLWNVIRKDWHRFGRYTAFFILQTYKHTCDLPIECPTLFLDDFKGSESHRNGLILAAGKDEWIGQKLSAQEYAWLEGFGKELVSDAKVRWPEFSKEFDLYTLETQLCAWKKYFRVANGRYVNYYNDRVADQIRKAENNGWSGVEWNVLHQCRAECSNGRLKSIDTISKEKMSRFV
jgi:hypothetical protein